MKACKSEGIVLKSYAYKDRERVIHLFTPDRGIVHLIVKNLSVKNPQRVNLTTPLCRGEYVYYQGKSEIYRFVEGSILNLHLALRASLKLLKLSANMLHTIHASQLPQKPSPKLYQLLLSYLKKLPLSPESLWMSFHLKLLKQEGLLSFQKPDIRFAHTSYSLNEEEWLVFILLLEGRDFSLLEGLSPPKSLREKIENVLRLQHSIET